MGRPIILFGSLKLFGRLITGLRQTQILDPPFFKVWFLAQGCLEVRLRALGIELRVEQTLRQFGMLLAYDT